jgi:hypothetical protein
MSLNSAGCSSSVVGCVKAREARGGAKSVRSAVSRVGIKLFMMPILTRCGDLLQLNNKYQINSPISPKEFAT